MTKNYTKQNKVSSEPRKSTIDFILNYSKALHINISSKVKIISVLN